MHMKWWGWGAPDKQPDISNMPKFLPYVKTLLGCDINHRTPPIAFDMIQLSPVLASEALQQHLQRHLKCEQIHQDKLARLIHSYGKSYRDLVRIRMGVISRAPDLIVFPQNCQDVKLLIDTAMQYNVSLIPFGGGTNIVGALEAVSQDPRTVISVDMGQMNKILNLNKTSYTATIQAGALGPDIEAQLNPHGFSLGHFPDSFEFSTIGGWLATRSVGMQSDQCGTIADMTLAINCLTPSGALKLPPYPHASMGPDLNALILGSEGRFGIITDAIMQVQPLPEVQTFAAMLFPDFASGIAAIREGAINHKLPQMMRLLDADETQLSMHFKPAQSQFAQYLQAGIKKIISYSKKIDFASCCVAILAFAGTKQQVKQQQQAIYALCKQYGACYLGQTPGKEWYNRKYDYPYLRDLIMDLGCVVDVAETSALWQDVPTLYKATKEAGYKAMQACIPPKILPNLQKPGFLGCHLSHHYQNGTCLYFTFAFQPEIGHEIEQYNSVKGAIVDAIIKHQGSLSHHHSIGYEHAKWLPAIVGDTGLALLKQIKNSLDPLDNLGRPTITA